MDFGRNLAVYQDRSWYRSRLLDEGRAQFGRSRSGPDYGGNELIF